jgi:phosphatidylinositol alpha-mannosyltransferase
VELVDLDDDARLTSAYADAWVTVLPSVSEAFGLVLVESLASGTPVVGSALGGIAEIVDRPEVGRLFEDRTPDALARAVLEALELAEDPDTVDACRARAADYSQDRCTDAYARLYAELVEGSPRREP